MADKSQVIEDLFTTSTEEQPGKLVVKDLFSDASAASEKNNLVVEDLFGGEKKPGLIEKAGDLYNKQAAASREILRGVFGKGTVAEGSVKGFKTPEESKKFQDEWVENTNNSITKFEEKHKVQISDSGKALAGSLLGPAMGFTKLDDEDFETIARFTASLPASTAGVLADSVNPVDLALTLLGEKAVKYVGKIPLAGKTIGERATGPIEDLFRDARVDFNTGKNVPKNAKAVAKTVAGEGEKIVAKEPVVDGELKYVPEAGEAPKVIPKEGDLKYEPVDAGTVKDSDYAGNINVNKLQTSADAEQVIKETATLYKDKITEQQRGTITHEQTKKLADKLGMDAEKLMKTAKGKNFNDSELIAAEEVLKGETNKVVELQKKILAGDNSDAALDEFRRQVVAQANVQKAVMGAKTETGRALQANKIIVEEERRLAAKSAIKATGLEKEDFASLIKKATKKLQENKGAVGNLGPADEEALAAQKELLRRAKEAGIDSTEYLIKNGIKESTAKEILKNHEEIKSLKLSNTGKNIEKAISNKKLPEGLQIIDSNLSSEYEQAWLSPKGKLLTITEKAFDLNHQPDHSWMIEQVGGDLTKALESGWVRRGSLTSYNGDLKNSENLKIISKDIFSNIKNDFYPGRSTEIYIDSIGKEYQSYKFTVDDFIKNGGDLNKIFNPKTTQESLGSLIKKATKGLANQKGAAGSLGEVDAEMVAAQKELLRRAGRAGAKSSEEVTSFLVKNGIAEATAKEVAMGIGSLQQETGGFAQKQISKALSKEDREITEDIVQKMSKIDLNDPIAVNKFIRDIGKVKGSDKAYTVFINSILSSPLTHIVNTTGNILRSAVNVPVKAIAAGIESPKRLFGKQPDIYLGEAGYEAVGKLKGFSEGIRRAVFNLRHGLTEEQVTKFDVRPTPLKGKVGEVITAPTRALAAEDEVFKAVNANGEIYGLAYRKAAKEGLKGKAFNQRVGELIADPTPEMLEGSAKAAERQTFQDPLGSVGQTIMRFRNKVPGLRWVAPFVKTPTNIFKEASRFSPVGLGTAMGKQGTERSMELGQAVVGSGIAGFFSVKVMEGQVTGAAPRDRKEREMFYAEGKQPYSLKVGDKWISYQRVEPFATAVGLIADAHELWKDHELNETEVGQVAVEATKRLAATFTEKSFMSGISSTMNAIEDPERYGAQFASGFASGMIWPAGMLRTITRATDDTMRDPQGKGLRKVKESIMANLPGLSKKVQAKLDLFGEEVKRPASPWERTLSPFPSTQVSSNPVIKEMVRLGVKVGIPGKVQGKISLTPEEYFNLRKNAGQSLKTAMGNLMHSDSYKALPDSKKTETVEKLIDEAKKYGVNQLGFGPKKRVFMETMQKVNNLETVAAKKEFLLKLNKEKKIPEDVLIAVAKRTVR